MTNKPVKLKNRSGDYLYPYTENIPTASTSMAGKVKLDSSPTSGSNNAITSGAVHTALAGKLDTNGTAAKATADAEGNNIASTYSKQSDIQSILALIYPVGSIYIGTQSTCPLASLIPNSAWEKVEGRYLLASGVLDGTSESYAATNTVPSGLPNIFDYFYFTETYYGSTFIIDSDNGLIRYVDKVSVASRPRADNDGSTSTKQRFAFNARNINSIFGNSGAVRSPAYVVNVWRRTA